jgi:hypothetical protein
MRLFKHSLPLLLVFVVVSLAACTQAGSRIEAVGDAVYFEPVATGHFGGFERDTTLVVDDEAMWRALSARFREPVRAIDFEQFAVLVAATVSPTGGYRVRFAGVEQLADGATATYVVDEPGPDCLVTMVETAPFQAVSVPRLTGPVTFERQTVTYRCERR